jgi:hypothetical protein
MSQCRQRKASARWNPDRDQKILHGLGRAVLLTVLQIQKIGQFGSREAAARRMRKLSMLGFIRIFKPKDKTEAYRYGLTEAGKNQLLADEDISPEKIHIAKGIDRRDLLHLGKLADTRIHLGLVCDKRDDLVLVEFLGESDLRRLCRSDYFVLLPDAFFILETNDSPKCSLGFWLELDFGTESARRMVESKFRDLAMYAENGHPVFGVTKWVVLVLVEKEKRALSLARHLAELGPGFLVYISLLADLLADPLGYIWRTAPMLLQSAHFQPVSKLISIADLLFQRGVPAAGTMVIA